MPIIPGLGDRLREARRKSGLSLEELAEKAGSNRRSLYSYEKGLVDPRVGDLLEIARVLKVTVASLVGEDQLPLDSALENQVRMIVQEELRAAASNPKS